MISTLSIMQVLLHMCLFLGNVFKYTKRIIRSFNTVQIFYHCCFSKKVDVMCLFICLNFTALFPSETIIYGDVKSKSVVFCFWGGKELQNYIKIKLKTLLRQNNVIKTSFRRTCWQETHSYIQVTWSPCYSNSLIFLLYSGFTNETIANIVFNCST